MKLLKIIERTFFPEKCVACGKIISINESFCSCGGNDEIKLSYDCCENCGAEWDSCTCRNSTTAPLPHITGVYLYSGAVKNKLINYKFDGKKELYKFFGDALSERIAVAFASADFDTVTFVPSSESTVKERGYNHCSLISEHISKKLFSDHEELLIKRIETPKQHKLTAKERMTNVKGSISLKENANVKGKTVLLCDDIKTTGATLKECTDVLLSAGAKDVYCAAVAITANVASFSALDKER